MTFSASNWGQAAPRDAMNPELYSYDFTGRDLPVELGNSFWLDGRSLSRTFFDALPARSADLLDVVMAIYTADRRSRRDFGGARTGRRAIEVQLGLRDPAHWARPAQGLEELLWWVSEDEWSLRFDKRKEGPSAAEEEQFLFALPPEPPVTVSLFSGGLDSIAGLASHAQECPDDSRVLVSGSTHTRLKHLQQTQMARVRAALEGRARGAGARVSHVAVPFGIRPSRGQQEEKGQRTRALVFLALGVVAAVQARADALWVYENGIGALNLPLSESQLGVDNYRGVHPRSLMMFECLVEQVLGQPIRVRNPFLFRTKAEMCRGLLAGGLADTVKDTVSCDSFPLRVKGTPQCGSCTSCVLRRQALCASGLARYDPSDAYRDDLSDSSALSHERLFGLEVMRGQVYRLEQCLAAEDPWRALVAEFPELARTQADVAKHEGLEPGCVREQIVTLYRTYVSEWRSFPHPRSSS